MGELVIEPDYMNAFRISFHISDAGIEYLKESIHPKYVNLAPEIIERVFYPKHVLKGRVISTTHKKEVHSTPTLKILKSGWDRLTFEQLRVEAKSSGWKLIKQGATNYEVSFYRFSSMIHLGGSDIGPFTPENVNRIYDFLKPAIEELLNRKNSQMDHLLHTLEWGPRALELGTAHPNLKAAQARVNGASTGGSKTRRRRHRKRKIIP